MRASGGSSVAQRGGHSMQEPTGKSLQRARREGRANGRRRAAAVAISAAATLALTTGAAVGQDAPSDGIPLPSADVDAGAVKAGPGTVETTLSRRPEAQFVPGEVIVRYRSGVARSE